MSWSAINIIAQCHTSENCWRCPGQHLIFDCRVNVIAQATQLTLVNWLVNSSSFNRGTAVLRLASFALRRACICYPSNRYNDAYLLQSELMIRFGVLVSIDSISYWRRYQQRLGWREISIISYYHSSFSSQCSHTHIFTQIFGISERGESRVIHGESGIARVRLSPMTGLEENALPPCM